MYATRLAQLGFVVLVHTDTFYPAIAENDDHQVQRRRQIRDLCHPDAGVHDQQVRPDEHCLSFYSPFQGSGTSHSSTLADEVLRPCFRLVLESVWSCADAGLLAYLLSGLPDLRP